MNLELRKVLANILSGIREQVRPDPALTIVVEHEKTKLTQFFEPHLPNRRIGKFATSTAHVTQHSTPPPGCPNAGFTLDGNDRPGSRFFGMSGPRRSVHFVCGRLIG